TDSTIAPLAAQDILYQLDQVNAILTSGDARSYWSEQFDAIKSHAENIANAQAIEVQRKQFEFVSIAIINSVTAFGTSEKAFYVQHCPMAFDNEGADWLATEEGIRNPYFGDKMMKCGIVKEVIE
ncbi:MAG: DUF3347 domain-containing protein, partial [Bacteroidota bacterium]